MTEAQLRKNTEKFVRKVLDDADEETIGIVVEQVYRKMRFLITATKTKAA